MIFKFISYTSYISCVYYMVHTNASLITNLILSIIIGLSLLYINKNEEKREEGLIILSKILFEKEKEEMQLDVKIKKLNDLMKEIRIEIQSDTKNSETLIKGVREDIQYELCRFAKMMVPNIHQKIDEIIEVDDRRTKAKKSLSDKNNNNNNNSRETNIRVSDKSNGADLVNDETDEHSEIKVSILTKEKRCNIMWNIPSGDTLSERRNKLIKSAETKTKNGKAYFIIKSKSAVELKRYEFGSLFLQEYFKYYDFNDKSSSINFGCTQCKSCGSFHRLDHFKEEEAKFERDKLAYVAKAHLYDVISSDCNNGVNVKK